MKKTLVLLAVASAFSGSALAVDRQFDAFMGRVVGNQTTVTFGGGGQPIVTSSSHLGTPNTVGNMATYGNASGVGIEGRANLPVAGTGKTVPVDVKAPLSRRNFGKALILAGKIAWPIGVALQAGDIFDYLTSQGYEDIVNTPDGVTGRRPYSIYFEGKQYRASGATGWYPTPEIGCSAYVDYLGTTSTATVYSYVGVSADQYRNWKCSFTSKYLTNPVNNVSQSMFTRTAGSNEVAYVELNNDQEFIDDLAQRSGWPTSSARALAEALRVPGIAPSVVTDTPNIVGPFAVPGEKTTTSEPAKLIPGTTTVAPPGTTVTEPGTITRTSQTVSNITYNQNTATTTNTTTSTTNITNNVTNQTVNEGDTVTETEDKPVEVCGLPGTPACKIDETGTPDAKPDTAEADAKKALKPLDDLISNPQSALPTLPTINWAFTLPSGCAPIALPAFDPWLQEIDVCAFQPMFHDIMTFVWVLGGIFGAIGTFWRNTFSQG